MNTPTLQSEAPPTPTVAELILLSLERTRTLLQRGYTRPEGAEPAGERTPEEMSPLERIVKRFELSRFESDVLVLCSAVELDPNLPGLLEASAYTRGMRHPTFQLLLNLLPESHWSTLMPQAPLRRWKLVQLLQGESLTSSPLRIEESVLHFLMGGRATNERLEDLLRSVAIPDLLPRSYRAHVEKLLQIWNARRSNTTPVRLAGNATHGKAAVAATACAALGLALRRLEADSLPERAAEREAFLRLLELDSALNDYGILLDVEKADGGAMAGVAYLAERFQGFLLVTAQDGMTTRADLFADVTIDKPSSEEQEALWRFALGGQAASLDGDLDRLARQFSLDFMAILQVGERAMEEAARGEGQLSALLWDACKAQSRPVLESLATRMVPRARWKNIVLPEGCMESLRTIVYQMRQRNTVLSQWEAAGQTSRGLGTAVLFCGPSGTGKTLAAEILANELSLDLFHIDLSQVVSKYIGETEKNLRTIFDAAEDTGAILLFDEADALFGKRSEIRDSHDRYANIEVSYLLQRMEAYRGLAILTTNQRASLDGAFLRRLQFVVHFPYPDTALRRQIWERIFPEGIATEKLEFEKLARLNVPGGNIRNIALNAACIASERGEPVRMQHLLTAARRECSKLERPWNEAELGGWV
jgi:hypothetical protein